MTTPAPSNTPQAGLTFINDATTILNDYQTRQWEKSSDVIFRYNNSTSRYEAVDGSSGKVVYSCADAYATIRPYLASGKTLFFKPNTTYYLRTLVNIDAYVGLRLVGADHTAILKLNNAVNHHVILLQNNPSDIEIVNLGLDGNGANQVGWCNGITIKSGSNIRIVNNEIYNVASSGLATGPTTANVSNVWVLGNVIHDTGQGTPGDGMDWEPTAPYYNTDFKIGFNTLYDINRYGILLYTRVNDSYVFVNDVSNCSLGTTTGDGIRLNGALNNTVFGNIIHDFNLRVASAATGIGLLGVTGACSKNNVYGNHILNVWRGMNLGNATLNAATDNAVSGCIYGVHETNGSSLNKLSNNNVYNAKTPYAFLSQDVHGNSVNGKPSVNSGYGVGTGAMQTIPHGLPGTPSTVIPFNKHIVANAHLSQPPDATNIYITADNGKTYGWYAKC